MLGTLCSSLCSGWVMIDTLCRSPGGKSYSWVGHVSVLFIAGGVSSANLFCISKRTPEHLCTGNSFSVVTSLSDTSWRCSFHMRNGTWQCCGIVQRIRIFGMLLSPRQKMIAAVVVQQGADAPSWLPNDLHISGEL